MDYLIERYENSEELEDDFFEYACDCIDNDHLIYAIYYLNKAIHINKSNADAYFLRGLTKKKLIEREEICFDIQREENHQELYSFPLAECLLDFHKASQLSPKGYKQKIIEEIKDLIICIGFVDYNFITNFLLFPYEEDKKLSEKNLIRLKRFSGQINLIEYLYNKNKFPELEKYIWHISVKYSFLSNNLSKLNSLLKFINKSSEADLFYLINGCYRYKKKEYTESINFLNEGIKFCKNSNPKTNSERFDISYYLANKYYIKSLCKYELRNFHHALDDLNIAEFYFKNCILILNELKKEDSNYFDSDSEEFIYLYYLQGLCNYELENFEEAIYKLEKTISITGAASRFDNKSSYRNFLKSKKDFDIKQLKFSYTLLLEYLKNYMHLEVYKYVI